MIRVLLVDDETLAVDRLRSLLAHFPDIELVGTAHSGDAALDLAATLRPDALLLDVEMPILDGPGMVEALMIQRTGQAPIPIVLVSAARNIEKIAGWVGTAQYLKKPFSVEKMIEIVDLALDSRRR